MRGPGLIGRTGSTNCEASRRTGDGVSAVIGCSAAGVAVVSGDGVFAGVGVGAAVVRGTGVLAGVAVGAGVGVTVGSGKGVGDGVTEAEAVAVGAAEGVALLVGDAAALGADVGAGFFFRCLCGLGVGVGVGLEKIFLILSRIYSSCSPRACAETLSATVTKIDNRVRSFGLIDIFQAAASSSRTA